MNNKFDLQNRLVEYVVKIIKLSEQLSQKIQLKRNDSDSTDSTWNLDIPCWILDIQLYIVKINDAYKYNP